ncbi:cytochrome b5-like heme/steroid binding domain-containing protein [Kockovaella imperatae]|uniref:Cytochrome b5-like heme/steroid binding domain-containing protein n=1 Tax=Kockovaella imperatae TaxID=4999 RepID=A0A1Y1UJX4_9TREE|nr:cytochrome b5-like heme/steroid binding domain-containing protein [Kockovaella imperatae]ORX37425.1 cytochrome b5-like heme/steroid binding domain-containing protein [Kockovaella imperatae]
MSLTNPLNMALIPPILYLIYKAIFPTPPSPLKSVPTEYSPDTYNWMPAKHPHVLCYKQFTPVELAQYDGINDPRICLAIMRVPRDGKIPESGKAERTIFDVSSGRNFYGPDGMYGNFAGRDASRGMAKQSFDDDMLTPVDQSLDTLADLTQAEIDNMRGWHEHFERKYTVCGELVDQKSSV